MLSQNRVDTVKALLLLFLVLKAFILSTFFISSYQRKKKFSLKYILTYKRFIFWEVIDNKNHLDKLKTLLILRLVLKA